MSFQNNINDFREKVKPICEQTADMGIAVCELNLLNTIRDFEGKSFMFDAPEAVDKLDAHPLVDKYGHSGASFAFCLRNVQFIARNGIDAYLASQK